MLVISEFTHLLGDDENVRPKNVPEDAKMEEDGQKEDSDSTLNAPGEDVTSSLGAVETGAVETGASQEGSTAVGDRPVCQPGVGRATSQSERAVDTEDQVEGSQSQSLLQIPPRLNDSGRETGE